MREKGKYEYNKQEIPENLKYHSDESDSSFSKTNNSKNIKDKSNNKNRFILVYELVHQGQYDPT